MKLLETDRFVGTLGQSEGKRGLMKESSEGNLFTVEPSCSNKPENGSYNQRLKDRGVG